MTQEDINGQRVLIKNWNIIKKTGIRNFRGSYMMPEHINFTKNMKYLCRTIVTVDKNRNIPRKDKSSCPTWTITPSMVEAIICTEQFEFTYPLFKQNSRTESIIKFTSLTEGVTVMSHGHKRIGTTLTEIAPHTDAKWIDLPYNIYIDLYHGQPIECWDNTNSHARTIGFYDAKYKCSFDIYGDLNGPRYDNYKAIDNLPKWMQKAFYTLKQ